MSAHTAEPWRVEERLAHVSFPGGIGIYGKDRISATVLSHPALDDQEQMADFRRIVACVNACAGVPQSVLETIGPMGGFANGVAVLMEHRDELATALRDLVEISEIAAGMGAMVDRPDMNGPLPRARAVLAMVKP